jgi:hypothetical protein
MGKRKITHEGNYNNLVLPTENDVLGVAIKMLGADRIMVRCQDGKERLQNSRKTETACILPIGKISKLVTRAQVSYHLERKAH